MALFLRALLALRSPALYPDGVVELENARALLAGRWGDVMQSHFHPLYAALVALTGALGMGLERGGELVAVVGSSLAAPTLALVGAALTPSRPRAAALASGTLAATQPYLVRFGGEVLAHGLSHGLLALAVLGVVLALRRDDGRWALAAGGAVGLGYMARTDALVTGLGLGLALCGRAALPGAARARRLLPMIFLAGVLLGMSPYACAIRAHSGEWHLTLKKTVRSVLKTPARPPARGGVKKAEEERTLAELLSEEPHPQAPELLGLGAAQAFALRVALATAFPSLVALAALGLSFPRRIGRAPPGWEALPLAALVFVVVQGLLKANWNTTDRVHQAALGVLVAPLAGRGLVCWSAVLARRVALTPNRLAASLLGILLLAGPLPKALAVKKPQQAMDREVGAWIRADAGPGPLTVCGLEARPVAWHAQARYLPPPAGPARAALAQARAAGARYLVAYLRTSAGTEQGAHAGERLRRLGLTLAHPPFRAEREGRAYLWWVFHLGKDRR